MSARLAHVGSDYRWWLMWYKSTALFCAGIRKELIERAGYRSRDRARVEIKSTAVPQLPDYWLICHDSQFQFFESPVAEKPALVCVGVEHLDPSREEDPVVNLVRFEPSVPDDTEHLCTNVPRLWREPPNLTGQWRRGHFVGIPYKYMSIALPRAENRDDATRMVVRLLVALDLELGPIVRR